MHTPETQRVRAVAQAFLDGPGWALIEEQELTGDQSFADIHPVPQFYDSEGWGRHYADVQASEMASQQALNADIQQALQGGPLDEASLVAVREQLAGLEQADSPQLRGIQFESVMEALLTAHGCTVERGLPGDAEQIDLFMLDPYFALIECRWAKARLEPDVVSILRGKLMKRPSNVVGLYLSMSGFTEGAKKAARDARDRTIFLVDREEIEALAAGSMTFRQLWDAKMYELLTQYPR